MALPSKKLLIPRKGHKKPSEPVTSGDNDTNMRTIEQYVNGLSTGGGIVEITSTDGSVTITDPTGPIVDLSVSGTTGGYDSLTGPGETSPTGTLTQGGELIVSGTLLADGIFEALGPSVNIDVTGAVDITGSPIVINGSTTHSGDPIKIQGNSVTYIDIEPGTGLILQAPTGETVAITGPAGTSMESGSGASKVVGNDAAGAWLESGDAIFAAGPPGVGDVGACVMIAPMDSIHDEYVQFATGPNAGDLGTPISGVPSFAFTGDGHIYFYSSGTWNLLV